MYVWTAKYEDTPPASRTHPPAAHQLTHSCTDPHTHVPQHPLTSMCSRTHGPTAFLPFQKLCERKSQREALAPNAHRLHDAGVAKLALHERRVETLR